MIHTIIFSIATISFLILSYLTFTSFILKKNNIFISLFYFFGFFLNFIIMLYYILDEIFLFRNFTFSSMIIILGFLGNYFLFIATTNLKKTIEGYNIVFSKIFNTVCFIITICILEYFIYLFINPTSKVMYSAFIFKDMRIIKFYYLVSIYYYFLSIVHLPNLKEYNYVKISLGMLIVNFIIRYFYVYNIWIYITYFLFLILCFFPLKTLYKKSIVFNKHK